MVICSICNKTFVEVHQSSNCSTLCGNVFHYQCIISWLERSQACPQCNSTMYKLIQFDHNAVIVNKEELNSLKLEIADSKKEIVDLKAKIADFQNLYQCCLKSENENLPFNLSDTLRSFSFSDSEIDVLTTVASILDEITHKNKASLANCLKSLFLIRCNAKVIDMTIDLIFEKAITGLKFAYLCAFLCSKMQKVKVSFEKENEEKSFKELIIQKCLSTFESATGQEINFVRKKEEIDLCKNPEKMKELLLEYKANEIRLHRLIGNCVFMGQLFKQHFLPPSIILFCIDTLVENEHDEKLEALCKLLKIVGKDLYQTFSLNDTLNDKLKVLASEEMKSIIPSRIQNMINNVIRLCRKWTIPEGFVRVNRKLLLIERPFHAMTPSSHRLS